MKMRMKKKKARKDKLEQVMAIFDLRFIYASCR